MNTQPHVIKIVLFVCLALLVLITSIGSYMLYTIEYSELDIGKVPVVQEDITQDKKLTPTGTLPIVEGDTNNVTPPPLPETVSPLEEIEAQQKAREAELKNKSDEELYPGIKRIASPEDRIQDAVPQ